MLTSLQESGIALEKPTSYFLKNEFGKERVKHNDFSPSKYPLENGLVVDCEVNEEVLIECTNPKKTTWMNDEVMLKKLEYFKRRDPFGLLLRILIVSFAVFSQFIADKIKEMNINLVVLNIHADKNNFRAILRRFYHSKLIYLLKKIKRKIKLKPRNQVLLSSYIVSNNVVNSNTVNNTNTKVSNIISKHLHQHNFNENIISFIVKVRDKETERLNKSCGYG